MIFESDSFSLSARPSDVSQFVSSPSNLYEILPQERIENWQSDANSCSFKIKGLAEISLVLESTGDNKVVYASASEKPFPFKLIVDLQSEENQTKINARFDAEVNSFMGMMLKSPMTNFLNALGEKLNQKYA